MKTVSDSLAMTSRHRCQPALPLPGHRLALAGLLMALLAGCAGQQAAAPNPPSNTASSPAPSPASSLTKAEIPPLLLEAQKAPYAAAGDGSCAALTAQIRALDEVMGPDLDSPVSAQNPGLIERGASEGGNLITDTIRNSAEGAIPYAGWIKRLTGADKNARNIAAAVTAGAIRRGYLKGLRSGKACP